MAGSQRQEAHLLPKQRAGSQRLSHSAMASTVAWTWAPVMMLAQPNKLLLSRPILPFRQLRRRPELRWHQVKLRRRVGNLTLVRPQYRKSDLKSAPMC